MPLGGPRFGPRGPGGPGPMHTPRFKQFPPHMQPRMHYGPRQAMKPRQPNANNINQTRPPGKSSTPPMNKPIENQPPKQIKQEPKTPQGQNPPPKTDMKAKIETDPKPLTGKQDTVNAAPIKVVTSSANMKPQGMDKKTKINQPQQVNANGNYSTQQRDNQYPNQQRDNQYSNQQRDNYSTPQRDNYSTQQKDNQYSTQQSENQYPSKQSHPYSNVNDGRSGDQGNRSWQQGRQDYNKMGDRQNMNKPYYSTDRVRDRVRMISGPQIDLPPLDMSEKKFNSYSRLFVGNLQKNVTSEELSIVFSKYGEIGQTYVNKEASYAFINFDFKANALKAMKELDNTMIKGRAIKVRIAAISDGIRVKNLSPTISNELLEKAFSVFGSVESCKVIVDDRGLPTGEGTVVFKDKKMAFLAVKKCQEECYILSGTARPVVVTPIEQSDTNEEGFPEASLLKNEDYMRERSVGPHFADEGSFESELGEEWKKVFRVHEDRKKALEAEFLYDMERIEKKLILARVEFEKEKLRKELAAREAESAHLRRHFEADAAPPSKPYSEGNEALPYEPYGSAKRPADSSYDSAYTGAYEGGYKEPYDRPYGRDYDRGYGRDYDRAGYGTYSRDAGAYDRGYEIPATEPAPAERSKYEGASHDPHFDMPDAYPAFDRQPASDAYQANKRPRY